MWTKQGRFYVEAWEGEMPLQTSAFPPPKNQHIGAKSSVLWPSKYAKMRFRSGFDPAVGAHDAPATPLGTFGASI